MSKEKDFKFFNEEIIFKFKEEFALSIREASLLEIAYQLKRIADKLK